MRVTFLESSEARWAELEQLSRHSLKHVVLPDLQTVDDAALRRAHTYVFVQVFRSNGIERMAIGVRVLTPIEEEMQRRGMRASYWSMEYKRRSDRAQELRECCTAEEMADPMDLEVEAIRRELEVREETRGPGND